MCEIEMLIGRVQRDNACCFEHIFNFSSRVIIMKIKYRILKIKTECVPTRLYLGN